MAYFGHIVLLFISCARLFYSIDRFFFLFYYFVRTTRLFYFVYRFFFSIISCVQFVLFCMSIFLFFYLVRTTFLFCVSFFFPIFLACDFFFVVRVFFSTISCAHLYSSLILLYVWKGAPYTRKKSISDSYETVENKNTTNENKKKVVRTR